ncbi:MAG: type II toxin-antitoxin system HicB family antitoxin [Clostridia bacterium]|nr:type II toxin-antitoxin system HicB family antitoxin [Clostridia bacterium]
MKAAYPVIINKETFVVYVPDLDISTQGSNIENCIEMAREAIGLTGISLEDIGKDIPMPSYELAVQEINKLVTFVDVDFEYYRQLEDNKMVKRNCTIPNYLNVMGERAGFNFSEVLRTALMERLNLR